MQESRKTFHDAEDGDGENKPESKTDEGDDNAGDAGSSKRLANGHAPKHLAELSMRQRQSPKPKVRRGVGDAAQTELDSVDDLVYDNFTKIMMILLLQSQISIFIRRRKG